MKNYVKKQIVFNGNTLQYKKFSVMDVKLPLYLLGNIHLRTFLTQHAEPV